MKIIRVLTTQEKETLVLRLESGEAVLSLAKEAGVLRKSLYEWRTAYRQAGVAGLNQKRGPKPGGVKAADVTLSGPEAELVQAQARIADLERLVGRQQADLDFFAKPCGHGTKYAW